MRGLRSVISLDTWVTSDQHWSHENIRRYQGRPDDHFDLMHERWCERVGMDDVVLHLGDLVCYGDPETHPAYVDGLPGIKFMLRGNHDQHDFSWYSEAGFTVIGSKPFFWRAPSGLDVAFSHRPLDDQLDRWHVNVHGHIHRNPHHYTVPGAVYRNVCVEVTGYGPVRLRDVLRDTYRTDPAIL